MILKTIHKITLLIVGALTSLSASAGVYSVKASLDSAYILMGKQTQLRLEVVEDVNTSGLLGLRGDSLVKEVEIIAVSQPDTTDLGNNRRQVVYNLTIQSFDSGLYTLPPIPYISDKDTSSSNALTLKVIPVMVDSLATIHDYAGVVDGESKWYDWIPDWITDYWGWYVVGLVLILGVIVGYLIISGKGKKVLPQKKQLTPYEYAMSALNTLRDKHLCEHGQEREFYTELTDILRIYLERRFGINAMEMTSTQILSTLQRNEATRLPKSYMQQILEIADFVKFAKMRPLPDDNVKAFNAAIKFIEDTREVEKEPEPGDDTPASDSDSAPAAATSPEPPTSTKN